MANLKPTGLSTTRLLCLFALWVMVIYSTIAQPPASFRVLVVASADRDHNPMIFKAESFFKELAIRNHFEMVFTRDATQVNDDNLSQFGVLVQLHLAPFDLTQSEQAALQRYLWRGKGWVGVHAAGLTGRQFIDAKTPYWQWFESLMGGVIYSPHPKLQTGILVIEDRHHPVTKNLPASFAILDEWYEFDKSPRPHVHVLATADESSFQQVKPMGDHPLVWTNPSYERAIYIGIGHDVSACSDPNFTILMRDAILWAASPIENKKQSSLDKTLGQEAILPTDQVAYDQDVPKVAMVKSRGPFPEDTASDILNGLDLKMEEKGSEWRWGDAWTPHAGWFSRAMAAMSSGN